MLKEISMASSLPKILEYFNKINAIPRCSTKEARLAAWLNDWALERRLAVRRDSAGNLVIYVPASKGYESCPAVILQGHMDMVCEKTPASLHNFDVDPIISQRDGHWLTAEGTTLGADNGIAIAYALALAEKGHLSHPPLELLFTVDEESGLNGAMTLDTRMISGRTFINLDSEKEGVFTIGCAGGKDFELTLNFEQFSLPDHWKVMRLNVGGLMGGHSGIDIHHPRGNANKIMARILSVIRQNNTFRLIDLRGGSRHNAIPRDAESVIALENKDFTAISHDLESIAAAIREEYQEHEPNIRISGLPVENTGKNNERKALSRADTDRVIDMVLALPHGVAGLSSSLAGTVETSSNLATVRYADGKLAILNSQRSAMMPKLDEISRRVLAVSRLVGADHRTTACYPAWAPDPESLLLERSIKVYQDLFHKSPVVQVIHAGLECAIIGAKIDNMDMISLGPTIENPHSPSERLYLPSVENIWTFLVALLEDMK
jgi:dipeptidase D